MTTSKSSKSTSKSKAPAITWQASKSSGLSPQASMSSTVLCEVCYPSKAKQPSPITSHHPRGRWQVIPKGGKQQAMCTRHQKQALAAGGRLAAAMSRSHKQALAATQAKQAK